MKTLIWSLGYPVSCGAYMLGRSQAFRAFTDSEYAVYANMNLFIWVAGIILCYAHAKPRSVQS